MSLQHDPLDPAAADGPCVRVDGRCKLFCFPHAGGTAEGFRPWNGPGAMSAEVIPVEYPGRGRRFGEPAVTEFDSLLALLAAELSPVLDGSFAFYGQSMGALVAFELARLLRSSSRTQPVCVFVASRRAPHLAATVGGLSDESDERLTKRLLEGQTTLPAVFRLPAWRRHFLDVLRADLRATEAYEFRAEAPLSVPFVGFWGQRDPWVTCAEMTAWARHTDASFRLEALDGNHLLQPEPAQRALREGLAMQLSQSHAVRPKRGRHG